MSACQAHRVRRRGCQRVLVLAGELVVGSGTSLSDSSS